MTRRRQVVWLGAGTTVLILALLEVLSRTGAIARDVLPPISAVAEQLFGQLTNQAFWVDIGSTLQAWAIGLVISIVVAVPVGLVLGSVPLAYEWIRTAIEFLRPIPPVALIPLAILVWGPTQEMKVFLIVISSVWPLLFQTLYGVQDVDRVLKETARAYQLSPLDRGRFIVLPSTVPYLVTGLRISATIALIVTIAAELVSGAPGLGSSIQLAQASASSDEAWALIFTVGILGLLINAGFRSVERRWLRWHSSQRLVEVS